MVGVDGAAGVGAGGAGVMVDNGSVGLGQAAATVNQTGAIKCKSSISCGGDHHHHHHNHQTGEGCGSGCTESIMYTGALDQRPIVNQPERGE